MLHRIGSGGMGVVWEARDERLQRVVAVKQLYLQPGLSELEEENARQRALREARIAARLQHPHAIAVYDIAEHEGQPCLVMEYLPSCSLGDVLAERGPLSPHEVASIGRQVASALAAAHDAGIVHRDVKPGNVLIADDGTAKITDFGVSRAVGDVTVTQTGMVAGTPAYLAPEVARGKDPMAASDVFALGATLYAAVEGQPPFGSGDNQLALLHAVAAGNVRPPSQAGPLTAGLMSMLRVEPSERPTMAQASAALSRIVPIPVQGGPRTRAALSALREPASRVPFSTRTMPAMPPTGVFDRNGGGAAPPRRAAPPPPAGRPAAPHPKSKRKQDRRGRVVMLAAGAAIGLAAVFGVAAWGGWGDGDGDSGGSASSSSIAPAPPASVPTASQPVDTVSGAIQWKDAGELVIDYYSEISNTTAAWNRMTAAAQALFDGQAEFDSYWAGFSSVSASNARGVTENPDGSVNVPVDVSYENSTGASETKRPTVRVTRVNGVLKIDSDPRLESSN